MASQDDLLDFIDTRPEQVKNEVKPFFKEPVEKTSPTKSPVKESKATPKKSTPVSTGPKQSSLFNFVKKREEKKEDKISSQQSNSKKAVAEPKKPVAE